MKKIDIICSQCNTLCATIEKEYFMQSDYQYTDEEGKTHSVFQCDCGEEVFVDVNNVV